MTLMQWSYTLMIRAKSSTGTTLSTYIAGSLDNVLADGRTPIIPTRIGPPTYEPIVLEREGVDYTVDPVIVGYRPHLVITWQQRTPGIVGLPSGRITSGGWSWGVVGANLDAVLSSISTVGNVLAASLDGGTSWRLVNLASSEIRYGPIDGKAVGVTLTLEFTGKKVISTLPDLQPSSWGTAT